MRNSLPEKCSRILNTTRSRLVTSFVAVTVLVGVPPWIIGGGPLVSLVTLLIGVAVAALVARLLAGRIVKPLTRLIQASQEISEGQLSVDLGPIVSCEIGLLQSNFLRMVEVIRRKRMEAEDKLLHSETQASVGRLAAGVAHEINNPLTGVLTYTELLLRRKDLSVEVRRDLETVSQATERIRKIVRGLLDFCRETALKPQPTDLNGIALLTIPLMRQQALVKGVDVKFNPAPSLPMLTLDRSQFQSVLLNILLNALDATSPGGRITVSTSFSVSPDQPGKKGVAIAFEDTGCGIPAENMGKLFDPFFTTKEVGQGTGLGLSVSLGIVQRHGGTIAVKSEVGRGSTFTIWLPVDNQS